MKYLQFNPASVDANGLAPISAEVVSSGVRPPDTGNQIAVDNDTDSSGKLIDTLSWQLVDEPNGVLDVQLPAGGVVAADMDIAVEYQKVVADEAYFLANFVKIS
jgi:hypothetical protein